MSVIIKITETQLINLIEKQLINEQPGKVVGKVLKKIGKAIGWSADDTSKAATGKSATEISRNAMEHLHRLTKYVPQLEQRFSKEAVNELADFMNKSLIEGKTILRDSTGKAYLNSASGSRIPVEQLQNYLNVVSQEGSDFVNLSTNLPRELSGNPPITFRAHVVDILSRGSKKSAQNSGNSLPIGEGGRKFKELATEMRGWIQVRDITGNLSGWKFHIYSDNLDDLAFIYEKITPIAQKWGAGMKLASENMINALNKSQLQKGKGATLYLPSSVTSKNQQRQFLSDIQSALKGYDKRGNISGDKMITSNIGYRYELSKPIDQKVGVDLNTYSSLYKKNEGGGHNIPNNPDLFD